MGNVSCFERFPNLGESLYIEGFHCTCSIYIGVIFSFLIHSLQLELQLVKELLDL